jgi:hypothetical protein
MYLPFNFSLIKLPDLSKEALDILLNEHILKINQDPMSIPIAPFPAPPRAEMSPSYLPSHWSGPISFGQKVVLMIINSSNDTTDITMLWSDIPEFKNHSSNVFHFSEVSTSNITERWSTSGFVWTDIPPHGNIVMVIEAFPDVHISALEWVTVTYGD